jgi:Phenylalanyl-tRNA synthetase beta subunit
LLDRVYQTKTKNSYRELSKFPSIKKDITISVSSSTKYATLKEDLDQIFESIIDDDIELKICPKSIFKKSKQSQTKNISFSLEFNSKLRTLREDLIKEYFEKFTTLSGYDLI